MKLIRQLAVAAQNNRNFFSAGKLTLIMVAASIVGCAGAPDYPGSKKNDLSLEIVKLGAELIKSSALAKQQSYRINIENSIYREQEGYYISDVLFSGGGGEQNPANIYYEAIDQLCRRKNGVWTHPFCKKNDPSEEVVFFAKIEFNFQLAESLFSRQAYNATYGNGEVLVYERSAKNNAGLEEFNKEIREKLGYKTKLDVEEDKLKLYRDKYNSANSVYALNEFIRIYAGHYDPDNLISLAELRLLEIKKNDELNIYRNKFKSVESSYGLRAFIDRYEKNDPDGLIPQARARLKIAEENDAKQLKKATQEYGQRLEEQRKKDALEQEAKRKEEAAKRKEESAKQAKLEAWRKSIKLGDDTFCGPVIEVRQPMVRIAIKVPLSGYPSETWLKSGELYPDWMAGCRNVNGQIRPMF